MDNQGRDIGDRRRVVALARQPRLAGEEIPARLRKIGELPELRPDPGRVYYACLLRLSASASGQTRPSQPDGHEGEGGGFGDGVPNAQ